jgi:hypothetical protein
MSSCTGVMGSTYATVNVIHGPKTPEQRAAGLSGLRRIESGLVQKGWTVEPARTPARTAAPTTSLPRAKPARARLPPVSCRARASAAGWAWAARRR